MLDDENLPSKICTSCISLVLIANMVRINVVEAHQQWMDFLISEGKFTGYALEEKHISRPEMCRICMRDFECTKNSISVQALPENLSKNFLKIYCYKQNVDIPKNICDDCTRELQTAIYTIETCKAMTNLGLTDKCNMCKKTCKFKYRRGMRQLCDFILTLRDIHDGFEVDWIRNGRYCDVCNDDLSITKQLRYKSYKTEEVLKLQFTKYLLEIDMSDEIGVIGMETEYLEEDLESRTELSEPMETMQDDDDCQVTSKLHPLHVYYDPPTGDDSDTSETDHIDFYSFNLNIPPLQISFKCPKCKHTCSYEPDLYRHIDIMHSTEGSICIDCGLNLKDLACLRKHKLRLHYNIMDYLCDVCGKECPDKAKFDLHYTTHFDERNELCQICPATFKTPKSLQLHMRTHTGDKRYACEHCGKKFTHYSDKKRHTYTHTGEYPYICRLCNKGNFSIFWPFFTAVP